MKNILAEIITIGDEILYGQTLDTNSHFISEKLGEIGVKLWRKTTIADKEDEILAAFKEAESKVDIIIITGGLGPTNDDLTKPCLAKYFNCGLEINEKALAQITDFFVKRGREMTELNKMQAALPTACEMINNPVGTAPGMWFNRNGKVFISLPGVPHEMEYLIENEVIERIKNTFPLPVLYHKMIKTCGIGESFLADIIKDWEDNLPPQFKLAYLPTMGEVKLRLTASGPDLQVMEKEANTLVKQLESLAGKFIYGYGDDTLESKIGEILVDRGLTISTAESCTGGHLSHTITSVPGSSRYYRGSIIAYHNQVKSELLDVPESILQQHGAVSEETVKLMAENVRKKLHTDIGVATSGIAGPDGGTEEKPVGTLWMAYSDKNGTEARKVQLMKDRLFNIQYGSRAMLIFLYRKLLAIT